MDNLLQLELFEVLRIERITQKLGEPLNDDYNAQVPWAKLKMLKTNYVIAINSAFDVASSSTKEETF